MNETWKTIVKMLLAILTAIAGTFGINMML
jgi:hypothetical protein